MFNQLQRDTQCAGLLCVEEWGVVLVDSKEFRPRKDPLVGNLMEVAFTKDDLDNMSEGAWVAIVICWPSQAYGYYTTAWGGSISAIDPGKEFAGGVVVGAKVLVPKENHGPPVLCDQAGGVGYFAGTESGTPLRAEMLQRRGSFFILF